MANMNDVLRGDDPTPREDDYYCDHPFQITGEECPNCGAPFPINVRAFVSGDMDEDDLTRRLFEDGILEL